MKLRKFHFKKVNSTNDTAIRIIKNTLSDNLEIMRNGMINMKKYPKFSEHISIFLADSLFFTSDFYLESNEKKEMCKKFP